MSLIITSGGEEHTIIHGFKVHYSHFNAFIEEFVKELVRQNAMVIHLTRRNLIEAKISMAVSTSGEYKGVWGQRTMKKADTMHHQQVHMDIDDLRGYRNFIHQYENIVRSWRHDYDLPIFEVAYEVYILHAEFQLYHDFYYIVVLLLLLLADTIYL